MRKFGMLIFMLLITSVLAVPAFAQGTAAVAGGGAACEAMARNPAARGGIMVFLIIGLAFIESLVLFTLVIIFVKVV